MEREQEQLIKREVPTVLRIELGGRAIEMSRADTNIYTYYGKWAHMRHLFQATSESSGTYIWNPDDNLLMEAAEHGLTEIKKAEPDEGDVRNYLEWQDGALASELSEMGKDD